jgi:hypothetical protein
VEPTQKEDPEIYQSWVDKCIDMKYEWEPFYLNATSWPIVSSWEMGVVSTGAKSFILNAPTLDSNYIGTAGAGHLGNGKIVVLGSEDWVYYEHVQGFSPTTFTHRKETTQTISAWFTERNQTRWGNRADEMKNAPIILKNIITWLTKDSATSYEEVVNQGESFKVLQNLNPYWHDWHPDYKLESVFIDVFSEMGSALNPTEYPLVVIASRKIKNQNDWDLLKTYVEKGGNLLLAGKYWWGWEGKEEVNNFLTHFDLSFTDLVYDIKTNYPLPSKERLDMVQDNPFELYKLIKMKNSGLEVDPVLLEKISKRMNRLSKYNAPTNIKPVSKIIDEFSNLEITYPIMPGDDEQKSFALYQYHLGTLAPPHPVPTIDVTDFPGNVPSTAQRVERTLTFDTFDQDRDDNRNFRMFVPPQNWKFTGLYAPAGATIDVEILEASEAALNNFQIQINSHSDNIIEGKTTNGEVHRPPKVSTNHSNLKIGLNKIRNPFGGLIILKGKNKSSSALVKLKIKNAVQAPWINENTTLEEFENMKTIDVPWAVIESKYTVTVVSNSSFKTISDFSALRQAWEQQAIDHMDLGGLKPDDFNPKHKFFFNKMWHVVDKQISAGYAHSGHPAMYHPDWDDPFVNSTNVSNTDWGLYHEQGHNMQFHGNRTATDGETTNNLFPLYIFEKQGETLRKSVSDIYDSYWSNLQNGPQNIYGLGPWHNLAWWHQLIQYSKTRATPESLRGFDIIKVMYRDFREMSDEDYKSLNTDSKRTDHLCLMFSNYLKLNLISFFERWGRNISDSMKARINQLNLPEPEPAVWTYKP